MIFHYFALKDIPNETTTTTRSSSSSLVRNKIKNKQNGTNIIIRNLTNRLRQSDRSI